MQNISRSDFEYYLKNCLKRRIKIKELDIEAVITAIFVSDTGVKYQCRYFLNGDMKEVYFYEWEIQWNI